MITRSEFKEAICGRDADDYPLDRFGNRLGREYLDADPCFDWTVATDFRIDPATLIRAQGMHSRCRGAY